ncbi:phage terminase small subunit [Bacillus mycoides]|uniref:phage terminase small subunit n=1 Tax=Bacillus mycoides TaxID=1405 RepID=UPI0003E2777B|nr:phage terminase small subunit [Bacillus mycoides]ETT85613.1 phage terminase small subunit [Bacillus mycoides FSL H7-687]
MSRRSVERDKAFEIYKEHNGEITNRKIAELLSTSEKTVSEKTVGGWKTKDSWIQQLDGVLHENKRSTPSKEAEYSEKKSKGGAPKGNQNAVGNPGNKNPKWGNKNAVGYGPPKGNHNAMTHGFFRKHFPEDVVDLMEEIATKAPLDMLWENIMIQYAAIVRAQRIMLVKHHNDMTKELKKEKSSLSAEEVEYEIQFAWDKQATFMNAQSRAITTLSQLIERFDRLANADDKRRLELDKLKADIEKTKADTARIKGEDGEEYEDDGFKEALEGKVEEAWDDYDDDSEA